MGEQTFKNQDITDNLELCIEDFSGKCFRKIFTIPEVLAAARFLIKDEICLSQLILRMPLPGKGEQPWHVDWIPRKKESDPIRSVLSSLLLDDYTKENGTTVPCIFLKAEIS